MDPNSGRMYPVEEVQTELGSTYVDTFSKTPVPAHHAIFREGETIEIRGCYFMVKDLRRHRLTLIPVAKPSTDSRI